MKETGRFLSFFKAKAGEVKRHPTRAAIATMRGIGAIGLVIATRDVGIQALNDWQIEREAKKQASEAFPNSISPQQLKDAKIAISNFDKEFMSKPHVLIDLTTGTIKAPENVTKSIALINEETIRSENVSNLKNTLEQKHRSSRTEKGRFPLLLYGASLLLSFGPRVVREARSILRRFRNDTRLVPPNITISL